MFHCTFYFTCDRSFTYSMSRLHRVRLCSILYISVGDGGRRTRAPPPSKKNQKNILRAVIVQNSGIFRTMVVIPSRLFSFPKIPSFSYCSETEAERTLRVTVPGVRSSRYR